MAWHDVDGLWASSYCCLSLILTCPRWRKGGGSARTDPRHGPDVSRAKASLSIVFSYLSISSDGCAARRVKCDESRPECLRCTSTRRVCHGYPHAQSVDLPDISQAPLVFTVEPSADIHPCAISRRAFTFFAQNTSLQLAGFFGSVFWERLVLQAAHHEPAVRHAITALGSLHENHMIGRDVEVTFALQQYSLAITNLLAPLSQQRQRGVDVCLISCILFTCFEVSLYRIILVLCRYVFASHT